MSKIGTLIDLLDQAVAANPAHTMVSIRDGLRYDRWSTSRLRQAVSTFAGHLRNDLHLEPGSRVVIWAPNSPGVVAAHMGTMLAGLIPVPADVGSSDTFLGNVIRKTEAVAIVTASPAEEFNGIPNTNVLGSAWQAAAPYAGPAPAPEQVAEIVFTSGTTGDPKGVVLSQRNIVADVQSSADIVPRDVPLKLVSILPLSHMLEQTGGLYLPMLLGGSVHYAGSLQPPIILREMRRSKVRGMIVVPRFLDVMRLSIERAVRERGAWAQWEMLQAVARRLPIDMRRNLFGTVHKPLGGELHYFMCGGATLPRDIVDFWETLGVRICEGYGSTECAPVIASNSYYNRRLGTVGLPLPGVQVKLSGEGELLVQGENVFDGYWEDDEHTAKAFTEDRWFRTGDIATQDPDGALRIVTRLGDRIVLPSGQKIYPADIEAELRKEDGVLDCVVLGMPDGPGLEHVHAVIRPVEGSTAGTDSFAAAVRNTNSRLATHQAITGVSVWENGDFPRTGIGKVKRKEVIATLAQHAVATAPTSAAPTLADGLGPVGPILLEICRSAKVITPESDLTTDLGLDSLGRIALAAEIEGRLGIAIDEAKLSTISTVKELVDEVAAKAEKAETAEPPPVFADWPLTQTAGKIRAGLQAGLLMPVHSAFSRSFRVEGIENLGDGARPMLMIANHSSHVDTISILHALPPELRSRTAVAAATDYFYKLHFLGAGLSLLLNTFPFSRTGNVRASLERCGELVDEGWSILIYPEGTRSADGSLLPFKTGIGLLVNGLRVPVVPMAVTGGDLILPRGAFWPRRADVTVRIGKPVEFDYPTDPAEIAAQLQDKVAGLLDDVRGTPGKARLEAVH